MKKFLLITTILAGSLFAVKAQDGQPGDDTEGKKRVEALYVAYVTKQLELTPEDAQKFWPAHTQFESEIKGVNKNLPELEKQQAILNIKKKYQENFNRILGVKRCERFFKLRDDFSRKLLEQVRKRNANQRPKIRRGV
jgi:hypothetical protein